MTKDYSPFRPGTPVPAELFVGRQAEADHLRENLVIACSGRVQAVFLCGERGIGKTSLASFTRSLGERQPRMLGIHTFLGGVSSLTEMVRRVFDRILKESIDTSWHEKIRGLFGDHVKQVGLFGITVEFDASPRDLERVVHDFVPSLRRLTHELRDLYDGILLIFDDINGLASSADFANWLKSLVDEIATSPTPLPLCLLLVGLEDRRQSLIDLQPSLARVFDVVEIRAWQESETRDFYTKAFDSVGVQIDHKALELMIRHTGGLPVLGHEIGDAVFKADQDNRVDLQDAFEGIFNAAEIVGRKHLEPKVFNAIRSVKYRTILGKLADGSLDIQFKRGEAIKRLAKDEAKVFDNFLKKMTELGVLVREPEGGPGAYRFANLLHYLYFYLNAKIHAPKHGR